MEQGTPIKKLKGLEFYVYLYRLDTPRRYRGGYAGQANDNTIGFGYHGKNEHIRDGLDQVNRYILWLKDHLSDLADKYGKAFPDQAQFEVFDRFEADISTTIGYTIMTRDECDQYISEVLMRQEKRSNPKVVTPGPCRKQKAIANR